MGGGAEGGVSGFIRFVHREMYSPFFREEEKNIKAVGFGDTRLEYIIAWPCVCIELTEARRVHCKKY
jgi:hypothetical protein